MNSWYKPGHHLIAGLSKKILYVWILTSFLLPTDQICQGDVTSVKACKQGNNLKEDFFWPLLRRWYMIDGLTNSIIIVCMSKGFWKKWRPHDTLASDLGSQCTSLTARAHQQRESRLVVFARGVTSMRRHLGWETVLLRVWRILRCVVALVLSF